MAQWQRYYLNYSQRKYVSGASLAYNIASIIGATIAVMISLKINALYGLMGVGIYLAINAFLTLLALLASKETKNVDLTQI